MAAGCVWASYSTAFYPAAVSVAFASLIKSWGLGSKQLDLAAVPCALYTTITAVAFLYGFCGAEGVWPLVTRDVSLPLIQGQAQLPLLSWNLAQNAGVVHLMTFAVSKSHDSCPFSVFSHSVNLTSTCYHSHGVFQLQTSIAMHTELRWWRTHPACNLFDAVPRESTHPLLVHQCLRPFVDAAGHLGSTGTGCCRICGLDVHTLSPCSCKSPYAPCLCCI